MSDGPRRILVVKLGALGDVVQAFGPFAAIRAHHPRAHVTLLTTAPYAEWLARSPWFDAVWAGGRPAWTAVMAVLGLARRLRAGRFDRVYDLQTSPRTARYRWAVGLAAEWSGVVPNASHPHRNPDRDRMHTADRQREQLTVAGVAAFPQPELGWAAGAAPALPPGCVLLVPGGSAHRPGKRWPIARFAALARLLGQPVAVLGSAAEAPLAAAIQAAVPDAIDLTGRTALPALGGLARIAAAAVGNDTGPIQLLAAMGCPTVALFGAESDPALCAPRGERVSLLRRLPLAALSEVEVATALSGIGLAPLTSASHPSR